MKRKQTAKPAIAQSAQAPFSDVTAALTRVAQGQCDDPRMAKVAAAVAEIAARAAILNVKEVLKLRVRDVNPSAEALASSITVRIGDELKVCADEGEVDTLDEHFQATANSDNPAQQFSPESAKKAAFPSFVEAAEEVETGADTTGAGASGSSTAEVAPVAADDAATEREIIEDVVDALQSVDIEDLPNNARGDTIRGLLWALEPLVGSRVEVEEDRFGRPFNASVGDEEARAARAAIEKVWEITGSLLVGLAIFRPDGYVSRLGVTCRGRWSPGEFYYAIKAAREALDELQALYHEI